MHRPILTLTTDFGSADHFAGVLHGVIRTICPQVEIVDISHQVEPFQVAEGAFLLSQAVPFFPAGTIHIAVVDPGVGTARRPVLIECAGQFLVGPDNGVLASAYTGKPHVAREICNEAYWRGTVSRTFHGRDIFAPVAAHLAAGVSPEEFGPVIDNHWKLSFQEPQRTSKRAWSGTILHIDRFGNLITNFHLDQFDSIRTTRFSIALGPHRIDEMASTYADIPMGMLGVVVGSSGYLEICANQASAKALAGCGVGAPCDLNLYA